MRSGHGEEETVAMDDNVISSLLFTVIGHYTLNLILVTYSLLTRLMG